MLPFYKEADIYKSKMELIADFEVSCDERIYKKSSGDNLMITSYNVHFFTSASGIINPEENVRFGVERLLKFCEKTGSDVVLVQEALFDSNIISILKNSSLTKAAILILSCSKIVNNLTTDSGALIIQSNGKLHTRLFCFFNISAVVH